MLHAIFRRTYLALKDHTGPHRITISILSHKMTFLTVVIGYFLFYYCLIIVKVPKYYDEDIMLILKHIQ